MTTREEVKLVKSQVPGLLTTREEVKIVKSQLLILDKRIKNKPMEKHVEQYIKQLQELIQIQEKRICELLAENARLIMDKASLEIDIERIRNGYEEAPYK